MYFGDVIRASESKKLDRVNDKPKRNHGNAQSSHFLWSHFFNVQELFHSRICPKLDHVLRARMQDHPGILWIRPVDKIEAVEAAAFTRTTKQSIKGVLPAHVRVDANFVERVCILIRARQNVGLFWGDLFTDQGGLHLDEWGESHFELEKLWGEYRIFL